MAEGYFTGDVVLDPEVLTLRAQRDDLLNVSCAKLTVDISGATRSVVQTVDVQLYDYDGNPVENSNIRTNTSLIQAKVPVLTTREVELAVEFSGVPGAAMNSIKCDITPKTVRLNGEADVLDSIDKLVLATGAYSESNYAVTQSGDTDDIQTPSAALNDALRASAKAAGIPLIEGNIHSSDVFYRQPSDEKPTYWEKLRDEKGCLAVEMESFALFHNARVLGKRAACLLTISDSFVSPEITTAEQRQKSFTDMMKVALGAEY